MPSRRPFNWDKLHAKRYELREPAGSYKTPEVWRKRAEALRVSSTGVKLRIPNKTLK